MPTDCSKAPLCLTEENEAWDASPTEVLDATRDLQARGVSMVVVSLGERVVLPYLLEAVCPVRLRTTSGRTVGS